MTDTDSLSIRTELDSIVEALQRDKRKRVRKLLLHEREIEKMHSAVSRKGMTLVPLTEADETRWINARTRGSRYLSEEEDSAAGAGVVLVSEP